MTFRRKIFFLNKRIYITVRSMFRLFGKIAYLEKVIWSFVLKCHTHGMLWCLKLPSNLLREPSKRRSMKNKDKKTEEMIMKQQGKRIVLIGGYTNDYLTNLVWNCQDALQMTIRHTLDFDILNILIQKNLCMPCLWSN